MSEQANKLTWYTKQPLGNHQFYGPTSEWNETFKNVLYKAKGEMVRRYVDTFQEMDSASISLDERATLCFSITLLDFVFLPEIHDMICDTYDVRFTDDEEYKNKIRLVWLGSVIDIDVVDGHSPQTHNAI